MYEGLVKSLRWLGFMFPETHPAQDDADRMSNNIHLYCTQAADAIEDLQRKLQKSEAENVNLTGWLSEEHAKHLWIPVTERLPEGQFPVLVYVPPHTDEEEEYVGYVGMAYFTYSPNGGFWCGTDGNIYGAIGTIHEPLTWMPLPEPPKEKADA